MAKKTRLLICLNASDRDDMYSKREEKIKQSNWALKADIRKNTLETPNYKFYFKTLNQMKVMDGYKFNSIEMSHQFFLESTVAESEQYRRHLKNRLLN